MSDSETTIISVVDSLEFSFTAAEGLVASEEYHIRVRAKNFFTEYYALTGPWGAESTFYSSVLPQAVQSLSFDPSTRTKTDATISWQLHTDAVDKGYSTIDVYYMLWVDDCRGGLFTNNLVNSTTDTSYTISNIVPGTVCRFRMNTLNIIGLSEGYSEVLEILFAVEPDAPEAPELVARHGGDTSIGLEPFIEIKWKAPVSDGGSPVIGYTVDVSEEGGDWVMAYDGSADPVTR